MSRNLFLEKTCRKYFRNVSLNGEWVNFSCPLGPYSAEHKFKEDRSPSAGAVSNKDNSIVWSCFTCKGSGTLSSLFKTLEKKGKRSYQEVLEALDENDTLPDYELLWCEEIHDDKPEPLETINLFEDCGGFANASKYLSDRGISPVTAKKLRLQFNPDDPRIVFPVSDAKGRVFGFTSRAIADQKPKIKNYSGLQKEYFILGMELWEDNPVVIVEGLFAYAHLHEITKGKYFPYNIGAIMGSQISSHQLNLLTNFGRPVYCFLDNDAAGRAGVYGKTPQADWSKAKRELERSKGMMHALKDQIPTFIPKWPEGIDDPDSLNYELLCGMIQTSRTAI